MTSRDVSCAVRPTGSETTDDSDDDDVELSRVSGPRFGTAGGHLARAHVISTRSYITHTHTPSYTTLSYINNHSEPSDTGHSTVPVSAVSTVTYIHCV